MNYMKTIENCTVQDLINELKTVPPETKVMASVWAYGEESNDIGLELFKVVGSNPATPIDELVISGREVTKEEVPW